MVLHVILGGAEIEGYERSDTSSQDALQSFADLLGRFSSSMLVNSK